MFRTFAIFAVLIFAPGSAFADISAAYRGKNISAFLSANPGATNQRASSSGRVYHWRGGVESTGIPMINPGPGGGLRDWQVECQLEIHTNSSGVIQSIRVAKDTIGMWNFSRCNEIVN